MLTKVTITVLTDLEDPIAAWRQEWDGQELSMLVRDGERGDSYIESVKAEFVSEESVSDDARDFFSADLTAVRQLLTREEQR